jgi:catechol 2,3-dioxygenase-like lactoylglutathione lyase family enzyme
MITHVKFVGSPIRDQDRALAFYTEKLGFRIATDQPFNEKQRWIATKGGDVVVNDDRISRVPDGTHPAGWERGFQPKRLKLGDSTR